MPARSILLAASLFAGASLVAAQAAPNWNYFPVNCASQCAETIKSSYTCSNQLSGSSATLVYGCYCDNFPSDASDCASCLNSNDAAALANLVTSTVTDCPAAQKACSFQCAFDTCASDDVACQCSESYLASIYDCAACNTANGNTQATQLTDFNNLKDSCANQNYTGASQSFTTKAPVVASTAGYEAPSLTATGGGVAATGDAMATDGALAAGGDSTAAETGSAEASAAATSASSPTSMSRASAASRTSAVASRASGASASVSGGSRAAASAVSGAAASVSASGAASGLVAPALGGLLGVAGAIAALL